VQEFLIQTMPVCFLEENQNALLEDRLWAIPISFINYSRHSKKQVTDPNIHLRLLQTSWFVLYSTITFILLLLIVRNSSTQYEK